MSFNYDMANWLDIKARERLQAELNRRGVNPILNIEPDGDRAYIAESETTLEAVYAAVAKALDCAVEEVDSAVYDLYTDYFAEIQLAHIEASTRSVGLEQPETRATHLHVHQDIYGWYYCVSGITSDGLYFESEDNGPFEYVDQALESAAYDYPVSEAALAQLQQEYRKAF